MLIDIPAILKDFSISADPNVNPGWLNVSCPFCKDHGLHGGFNLEGQYFHCWKCGGHSLKSALRQLLRLDEKAYRDFIVPYSTELLIRARLNKKTPKAKKVILPGSELNPAERNYLKRRGFDPDFLVEKYQICGGGIAGEWRNRIIIPLIFGGRVVSFTSRAISKKREPRYLTLSVEASIIDPKAIFYNLDNAKERRVCILEGPFDVFRMGDNFICNFGTIITEAQISYLSTYYDEVVFLFDPEPEAQEKARKYAERLSVIGNVDVSIIDTEMDCDPGDLSEKQAIKLRKAIGF